MATATDMNPDSKSNLPLALAGGLGAGALGGLLGSRKTPSLNLQPLMDAINASKAKQTGIATALPGQLKPLNDTLSSSLSTAMDGAENASREKSQKFLDDLGKSTDAQGNLMRDSLRKNTLGALPEAQRDQREASAASGGLQRGGAIAAQEKLTQNTMGDLAQGETQINLQAQQAKQKGLETVYNMDENLIQQRLGISKETALALFNSGRTDLINEANQLLGIEQNSNDAMTSVLSAGTNQDFASKIAKNQQMTQLMQALLQGGTTAGMLLA